jgi:phenylpropionate dioxygenase-like ring-hydroxylating dioxygenase large terminal subunit
MALAKAGGAFLPAGAYGSAELAARERQRYATRFWHPVAAAASLPPGSALALELLDLPLLLTHPPGEAPRAFLNRCPHRGVAFLAPQGTESPPVATACRRLVCPYHGWTYDLDGELRAAAREGEFLEPFDRGAWPLQPLACQVRGGMVWVAIGPEPLALEVQLDLVLEEAGERFDQRRILLGCLDITLACNWKIAHDNTLDDYHVAIAHPTTLHRQQGPVRHYRHRLGGHANLLATPFVPKGPGQEPAAEFLTFGLPPWNHLLLWPDGPLAVIGFAPLDLGHCRMQLWLLGEEHQQDQAPGWIADLRSFLEEDRALVEAAQRGYLSGLVPGPAHRLEQRILHQQAIYAAVMGADLGL